MALKFSNFGKAIIASAPSGTSGLSFSVEAGTGAYFPTLGGSDYFYGIFKDAAGNREIVKVSARSGDSMTIATGGRGLDGTAARTWAAGDYFVAALTNIGLTESLSAPNISALAGLSTAADKLPYFTGSAAADLTDFTSFARQLLSKADALSMRNLLGAAGAAFASGTSMLFYSATAPTGWTHDTSSYDHALRLVAGGGIGGTAGGAGAGNFSSVFAAQSVTGTVGNTTLTVSQIPAHTHNFTIYPTSGGGSVPSAGTAAAGAVSNTTDGGTGGGGSHTHTFTGTGLNLAIKYVNVIRATKD